MSAASDYLEKAILDHVLGNTEYSQPANLYLGLFTADTGLETNSPSAEVSGGSYARKEITFDAAVSGAGTADSAATVTFDAATANWGTITHVAIVDDETGSNYGTDVNVLFYGAVTTSKTIESGDTFQVSAGNLTISLA